MFEKSHMMDQIKCIFVKYKYVVVMIAVGCILLLWPSNGKEKSPVATSAATQNTVSFTEEMEEQLEQILSKVKGVGRVEVFVTLECGTEVTYATNINADNEKGYEVQSLNNESSSFQETIVTTRDSSGNETPVVITTKYPKYRGALIVCDGGDNAAVKLSVTKAVSSILGIGSDSILVMSMKK